MPSGTQLMECSLQVLHCAGGEAQLYGNTCSVTVSSQGTEKADEKSISKSVPPSPSHPVQGIYMFLLFSTCTETMFSKKLLLMTKLFRFHSTKHIKGKVVPNPCDFGIP